MRLTLRTLLAYLDNTLDSADKQILEEKIQTSSIAKSLTDRIRRVVGATSVDSPSANAVGPNDDPNTVGEYIDSTLSPELTADLERHCLESDAALAEVAACHQILTIAEQGHPQEVPASLRQQIASLPLPPPSIESAEATRPANPSAAAAPVPSPHLPASPTANTDQPNPVGEQSNQQTDVASMAGEPTAVSPQPDLPSTIAAATKVIRKNNLARAEATTQGPQSNGPAMAGKKTRQQLEAIGPILSGGRPSRVAPLMVALGLAAAFLFVLTQAMQPIMQAMRDKPEIPIAEDSNAPVDLLPPKTPPQNNGQVPSTATANSPANNTTTPPAVIPEQPTSVPSEDKETENSSTPPPANEPVPVSDGESVNNAATSNNSDTAGNTQPNNTPPPATNLPAGVREVPPDQPSPNTTTRINPATLLDDMDARERERSQQTPDPMSIAPPPVIGGVEDTGGLLLTQDSTTGEWLRVDRGASLVVGQVLSCPPAFRARLMLDDGTEVTMVGPCAIRLNRVGGGAADDPQRLFFTVDFGRLIVVATSEPVQFSLATPSASGRCVLLAPGAAAAIAVEYLRAPGSDPLEPANSKCMTSLVSLQNRLNWLATTGNNGQPANPVLLETGRRWVIATALESQVDVAGAISWAVAGQVETAPAVATAKQGLIDFLRVDQPVEAGLREAVGFRQADVGALAAQTLLALGMPDIYFGPNGVLNQPQQSPYWPQLVDSLQAFFDRGPPSAVMVGAAAEQGNGEQVAGKVWGLLSGFSPEGLQRGGDVALVELMDDPSMAVRAVATEVGRQILGTTLDYRPEFETATRRSAGLKRWQARQRRGQIAWADATIAAQGRPRSGDLWSPPANP